MSSAVDTFQQRQKKRLRTDGAGDCSSQRWAADPELLRHLAEHPIADVLTAGRMRDVRPGNLLAIVRAREGEVASWVQDEPVLARQRLPYQPGRERHLPPREEPLENVQLPE